MEREDHYEVLGVSPDASDQEIKRAYKRLAVRFHPDQRPSVIANMLMRRITEAYEVLRDADRRSAYDAERARRPKPPPEPPPPSAKRPARQRPPGTSERPASKPSTSSVPPSDHRRVGRVLDDYRRERARETERIGQRAIGAHADTMRELAQAHDAEKAAVSRRTASAHRAERIQSWAWLGLLVAAAVAAIVAKLLL